MRKVRLLKQGKRVPLRPYGEENSPSEMDLEWAANREALNFFRHEASEEWFERVLEKTQLKGKRLTASRVRRVLMEAMRVRMERR